MPTSSPSPYRRHILGALLVVAACLGIFTARQKGWLDSTRESERELAERPHSRFTRTDDEVPDPIESDVRLSEWTDTDSGRLELEDGTDDSNPTDADPRVATVGFDDDVPASPPDPDEQSPVSKIPRGANSPIARRPTENSKIPLGGGPDST